MEPAPTIERYECLEPLRISRGFYVARCWDSELEREVVLKSVRTHRLRNRNYRQRLVREIKVADRARHPNLVELLEWEQTRSPRYCTLGYCPGGSLRILLCAERKLAPRAAAELCRGLAAALHHFHLCGYVHLDVKADNILLDADRRPVLCDYGMSRSFRTLRRSRGYLGGTPGYMSPEQAGFFRRCGVDQRADVFALGAVLYQALTGALPIGGWTRSGYLQALRRIEDEPVRAPMDVRRSSPRCSPARSPSTPRVGIATRKSSPAR